MSEPLLQVIDLKTQFHTAESVVTAVDGVSFSVRQGETLGIVGESGCGKSVTSMSILRLISKNTGRIAGGQILFEGEDLLLKSPAEMCGIRGWEIAMIFQDSMTALNPVLTIGRQMVEAICTHERLCKADAFQKAVQLLANVGIPSPQQRMKEYPHQLSGGMRQRVMIAMALSCDPALLIADEPTTALDVTIQAQILRLMKDLKTRTNAAILLITHDMGVVAEMADNILVMYAGQVMEYAGTRSIFKKPLHPYTQGLLASIPRLDQEAERLHAIQGAVPTLNHLPQGCRFCDRCPQAGERCRREIPPLFQAGETAVRCWNYETGEGGTPHE